MVLVHGYGASAYHWRYNIPELAKYCRVYAVDMLGFGWSEKVSTAVTRVPNGVGQLVRVL